jgi:hypothetical protein
MGIDESLLRGVLGQCEITEDGSRVGYDEILKYANEFCECELIPLLRRPHQRRDMFVVLQRYSEYR